MKKIAVVATIAILATSAFGVNYSKMSDAQLQGMRGKVSAGEKNAFRTEMQKRVKAGKIKKGNGMGGGNGQGMMRQGGMGQGGMGQGGMGQGMMNGKNKMNGSNKKLY